MAPEASIARRVSRRLPVKLKSLRGFPGERRGGTQKKAVKLICEEGSAGRTRVCSGEDRPAAKNAKI